MTLDKLPLWIRNLFAALFLISALGLSVGCATNSESIGDKVEDVGDEIEDAADEVEDEIDG